MPEPVRVELFFSPNSSALYARLKSDLLHGVGVPPAKQCFLKVLAQNVQEIKLTLIFEVKTQVAGQQKMFHCRISQCGGKR